MGNLVFSNAILDQANISPAELRLAVAVYLYIEKRLNLNQAQLLSGLDLPAFQKELVKRGIPTNNGVISAQSSTESMDKPHFLADLGGTLAGPDGDELAEIVSREFQQIEGEW